MNRTPQKLAFTGTALAEVPITGLAPGAWYELHRVVFRRTGGTADNYTLLVGDKVGFTDVATDGRIASFDAAAVAVAVDHSFSPALLVKAPTTGALYLKPQWDAGADNNCVGHIIVQRVS